MHQINWKIKEKNSIVDWGQEYEKEKNMILRLGQWLGICWVDLGVCFSPTTMAHGSKIPLEVHYIIIWLSAIMKLDDITIYTGILSQAVQCILWYFAMHGKVEGEKEHKTKNSTLCNTDLQVRLSIVILVILFKKCLVYLWSHSTNPWLVPWWAEGNTIHIMWPGCLNINDMVHTLWPWIYHEESESFILHLMDWITIPV